MKKLTVLFTPVDGIGHFNASMGIAEHLRDRGHNVVYAVPDSWRNKLAPKGFIEEWLNPTETGEILPDSGEPDLSVWGEIVAKFAPSFVLSPEEQLELLMAGWFKEALRQTKDNDPKYKRIIAKVKPDVIVGDLPSHQPAVMDAGIPFINTFSISPASLSSKNVPPAFTGYPTAQEFKPMWESYRKTHKKVFQPVFDEFKKWVVENGGPSDLKFDQLFLKYSPYANIYMYPEELDYTEFRPNPPNFYRFDTFIRSGEKDFEIPENLKNKPGKLIYFSMGTIGCCELNMMRRLISILAKSPHRFIVSKGPLGDEIVLAENMWGAKSVPQTKVLPLVDLVISHGGNNTVTESFYFGKPMIILPLFGDQPDNAQRVDETGLGIRLHSHNVTEEELLAAINKIAFDQNLSAKMKEISKKIQASNSPLRVAELVERVASNNK